MTCKHRWLQIPCIRSINSSRYMYICGRCGATIHSLLKENPSPDR